MTMTTTPTTTIRIVMRSRALMHRPLTLLEVIFSASLCIQLLMDDTAPGPLKRRRFTSPSLSPEPKLEVKVLSVKDRNQDLDEFFEPPETISGKKYRNCKFCR